MVIDKKFYKKKITLLGLGVLGRGVGDAIFLAERGADLIITDLKSASDLRESVEKLKKYSNVEFRLGGHRIEDFRDRDFVFKSAGVPLDSVYVEEAKKNRIPVVMSAAVFAENTKARLIGVTGTKGKSSVTHMLFDVLKAAGENVYLGGNVRGVSTLALLDVVGEGDWVILELDSWQLQGFGEARISPEISVFTNFMEDHLNYYDGDLERYFLDKANIFEFQKSTDTFVTNEGVVTFAEKYGVAIRGKKVLVGEYSFDFELPNLIGEHSFKNARYVLCVAELLGIDSSVAMKALSEFGGVSGRLEFVREFEGRKYYNDTTATIPDATIVGILSFRGKSISLIAGGDDKALDYTELAKIIREEVVELVLLPGSATDKLIEKLGDDFKYKVVRDLDEAVGLVAGEIVLFSPGATSFGMFKNEFDRGDRFIDCVMKLGKD